MSPEKDKGPDTSVDKRRIRLAKGVRKYIRRLKQSGNHKQADEVERQARREKRPLSRKEKASLELRRTIGEIVDDDGNPHVQVERQIKVIWLMQAAGITDSEQRRDDLNEVFDALDGAGLGVKSALIEARNKYQGYVATIE